MSSCLSALNFVKRPAGWAGTHQTDTSKRSQLAQAKSARHLQAMRTVRKQIFRSRRNKQLLKAIVVLSLLIIG